LSNLYKYIRATWITAYILSILIANIVSQKMYSQPKLDSHILLLTTSNTTNIYRDNNIYIILNPPLNTTIILKINKINEYHNLVIVKPIEIENGYKEYTIRFNETGTYTLNISWSGDQYYNPSWTKQTIEVKEEINTTILNHNLYIDNKTIEIGRPIKIDINIDKPLYLEIYSPMLEKYLYRVNGSIEFTPNEAGLWTCCLEKNGLRSRPQIFYVKRRTKMVLETGQKIIPSGEEVEIVATIGSEKCFGKIDLYIWKNNRWIKIDTEKIEQNTCRFYWKTSREGKYIFKAEWSGDIYHFKTESNILNITILSRKIITTLETLDSKGRKIIGTKIIIQNKTYFTIDGKINLILENNIYNITVLWKNTVIYRGQINITRGKIYKINCTVYELTIRLVSWPIPIPIKGQPVTIIGKIKTTLITDKNGETCFKQLPKGNYTIKIDNLEEKINLNKNTTIEIKQQSSTQTTILTIIILIVIVLLILTKIEVIITKE